jgi:hypothetical protein
MKSPIRLTVHTSEQLAETFCNVSESAPGFADAAANRTRNLTGIKVCCTNNIPTQDLANRKIL